MATVLFLGPARQAAGASTVSVDGDSVDEICDRLRRRYGTGFAAVLAGSRIWVDGQPASGSDPVPEHAEVSVLPPVSGGAE